MGRMIKTVCVFCGAQSGNKSEYIEAAKEVGSLLAQRNCRLVYGGGHVGLMGFLADSCLQTGGEVIGVIPKALQDREMAHPRITDLRVVDSMHERKALMEQLSDLVIALPGGFGTMDELNEIITWRQLGFHRMPIYLLNTSGYFDHFLQFLDRAKDDGFISREHLDYLKVCHSIDELNHALTSFIEA
ncbi:MAG: family protein YvdD [Pseudomonadota bacterium]|jgi:uncharacterized protein (TIGR00730 family)